MSDTVASRLIVDVQGKNVQSTTKDLARLDAQTVKLGKDSSKTEKSIDGMSSSGAGMGKVLAGAAVGVAAVGAAMFSLTKASLKNAAALEQDQIALTTMLRSADKANKLLKEMRTLGASTPFETKDLIKASKSMIAFGFDVNNVKTELTKIGDLAAGVGAPINELASIFGKAKLSVNLYAEDLNQLHDRGIPAATELGKVLGVSASQVKKLASEGKVSFKHLQKALNNMTKDGGQFGGMMAKQAKSLTGLWSTLQSQFTETSIEVGQKLSPAFKELLTTLTSSKILLPAIKAIFMGIAGVINGFVRAVTWVVNALENLGKSLQAKQRINEIKSMDAALKNLLSRRSNFMASTNGAARYTAELKRLKGMLVDLKIEQAKYTLENIKTQKTGLNKSMLKLVTGVTRARNAIDLLKKGNNKLTKTFEINDMGVNKTIKTRDHANRVVLGFTHTMKMNEAQNARLTEQEKKARRELQKNIALRAKLNQMNATAGAPVIGGNFSAVNSQIDKTKKKVESLKKTWVDTIATIGSVGSAALSAFDAIGAAVDAKNQAALNGLEQQMQAELKAAGVSEETTKEQAQKEYDVAVTTGDAIAIEEKRRALEKAKIEEKFAKERARLEYKAALDAWNFQMAAAAAAGALAILNAVGSGFRDGGIIGAVAFGAVAAIAAGANIAAVASAKPSPPSAQFGGSFMVPPGSPADSGSVNVNQGEKVDVTPVSQSGGGKNEKMTLQIGDRDFEAFLVDKMNKIANSGRFNITRPGVVKTV